MRYTVTEVVRKGQPKHLEEYTTECATEDKAKAVYLRKLWNVYEGHVIPGEEPYMVTLNYGSTVVAGVFYGLD